MRDSAFWRDPALGVDAHRARVLEQLKGLAAAGIPQQGFPVQFGGSGDAGAGVVSFEDLLLGDPSLQVKSGVQWGLFAGAILHLGSASHHERFLPAALSLETPGVFAMTEIGHGSNVAGLRTTATFDVERGGFILHTPDRAAWKDYLGNAALHGRAAVVFAQLVTGGESHGVHAFYVPIRDGRGRVLPGVAVEDDGVKGGLNGIDNGRLAFTEVFVPRENLLDRYGHVTVDGRYFSPIESAGRRFFTMLGTLVQGRVFLVGASRTAAQLGLRIAVGYADRRRQFGHDGADEIRLLDYREHQRRLLPRLAATYGLSFLAEDLVGRFHDAFTEEPSKTVGEAAREREELETLAAAVKPWATWHALDVLQACREACGGAGFMAENRLVGLRADLDIYATFEGDNTVLLQLAGKRLLGEYGQKVRAAGVAGAVAVMAGRVAESVWFRSGLAGLVQSLADLGSTKRAGRELRRARVQRRLLQDRVDVLTAHLARVLSPASRLPDAAAQALVNRHQHELVELGRASGDLLVWDAFTSRVDGLEGRLGGQGTADVLRALRDLYALSVVERQGAWFAGHGRLSARRLRAVTAVIDRSLLEELAGQALDLVNAFGFAPEHVRAALLDG